MAKKGELLQLASLFGSASTAFAGGRPGLGSELTNRILPPAIEQAQRQEFEKEQDEARKKALKRKVIGIATSFLPPGPNVIANTALQEVFSANEGSTLQTLGENTARVAGEGLGARVGGKIGQSLGNAFGSQQPTGFGPTVGGLRGFARGRDAGGQLGQLFGDSVNLSGPTALDRQFSPSGIGLTGQQTARINTENARATENLADRQLRVRESEAQDLRFEKELDQQLKLVEMRAKNDERLQERGFTESERSDIRRADTASTAASVLSGRQDVRAEAGRDQAVELAGIREAGANERARLGRQPTSNQQRLFEAQIDKLTAETANIGTRNDQQQREQASDEAFKLATNELTGLLDINAYYEIYRNNLLSSNIDKDSLSQYLSHIPEPGELGPNIREFDPSDSALEGGASAEGQPIVPSPRAPRQPTPPIDIEAAKIDRNIRAEMEAEIAPIQAEINRLEEKSSRGRISRGGRSNFSEQTKLRKEIEEIRSRFRALQGFNQ